MGENTDRKPSRRRWGRSQETSPFELEYMSDLSAAVQEQSPRGGRLLLWATVLFLTAAVIWAQWAELDEVTRGLGKVIPSRQVQVIQNLEGGILAEILVAEGDIVQPGQPLLRIDDTRFASSYREGRGNYLTLVAKVARLRAEALDTAFEPLPEVANEQPEVMQRELSLLESRRKELQSNLDILNRQLDQRGQELKELRAKEGQVSRSYNLAYQELKLTQPLVQDGAVSEVEILRLRRDVNNLRGDLEGTRLAIPRAQSAIAEAEDKLEELELQFRNEARHELNETLAELARVTETNQALEDRVKRTSVTSPVHGTVKQLLINTLGGVIQPGMDLLEIVPLEDTLLIEAKVRPQDIAFVRPGQQVVVKFTAYDFAIYGGLDATLEHISADTISEEEDESYYLVRVRTQLNFLGDPEAPLPIIPGMQTEVDILTGRKTVLAYLMKPVLRGMNRSLSER